MRNITFIPSGRGGRKVLFQGFTYTRHRAGANGSTWHCTQRHSSCKGRIKVNSEENDLQVVKAHNHLPDFCAVKAEKLIARAKKRCSEEPNILPAVLTRETYSRADDDALLALPRENSLKATLRRIRRKDVPQLPGSLEELENIPEKYQMINGVRWLIHEFCGK